MTENTEYICCNPLQYILSQFQRTSLQVTIYEGFHHKPKQEFPTAHCHIEDQYPCFDSVRLESGPFENRIQIFDQAHSFVGDLSSKWLLSFGKWTNITLACIEPENAIRFLSLPF